MLYSSGINITGQAVIPSDGVAGGIVTSNGLNNVYFETDNSLNLIINGTWQHVFNADGTVVFGGGYIFPNTQGTSGQTLVYNYSGDGGHDLTWQDQAGGATGATGPTGTNGTDGATGATGLKGNVVVSDSAPVAASTGDEWYDSVSGKIFIRYDNTWVDVYPSINLYTPRMPNYANDTAANTAVGTPLNGMQYYNTTTDKAMVYTASGWQAMN